MRVVRAMGARVQWMALTSSPDRVPALRQAGVRPLLGNLDRPVTLHRLAGLADRVLYLAPPPHGGLVGPRILEATQVLRRRNPPLALIYGSTTGVYGDCQGQWVTEERVLAPQNPQGATSGSCGSSGPHVGQSHGYACPPNSESRHYAPDRVGGTPKTRLQKGTPVLQADDDVYTKPTHTRRGYGSCLLAALWKGAPQRVYNVCDGTRLKMGGLL